MYTTYFGLSEVPFTISPDPAYLFMSDRHREALAHLTYGLGEHGGFVLLTGEVGTGKTTISRTMMEQLPENTQAAFILNPTLSSDELLATICDNLNIRYKKTGATLKYLTDKISDKLKKNHENGINTLLIIDEAQHLQPEVLEQLRLLTNLETNTKKLLQVILIGQPELQQLLQRRDLRQLAQRITARYHLLPLTKQELVNYIQHRLSVAQCSRRLFNKAAINTIHKISGGIPRVVNLLCDRALSIAYNQNQTLVNKKIALQAADQALAEPVKHSKANDWLVKAAAIITCVAILAVSSVWLGEKYGQLIASQQTNASKLAAVSTATQGQQTDNNPQPVVAQNQSQNQSEVAASLDEASKLVDSARIEDTAKVIHSDVTEQSKKDSINSVDDVEQTAPQQPLVLGYQPEKVQKAIELVAEPGVSQDLLERFKQAVEETEQSPEPANTEQLSEDIGRSIPAIHQLNPSLQDAIPSLQFEMHIFATQGKGWVRVNGEDRREGEQIATGVWLEKILPQSVILNFKDIQFSMTALSSW